MTTARRIEILGAEVEELLASHDTARSLNDFKKYDGDPVAFARTELGFNPYPKQVEVLESFHAHKRVAVRGFHGAGKDAVLACLILYAAYVQGMLVLVISATEKQLLGQTWREVRNRFSERLPGLLFSADLRINGEKRVQCMTSHSTSNLSGWHDPKGVFVVISEAQGEQTEAAAFDAALANSVDNKSRIIVAGNSIKPSGRFYEVSNKPSWHPIRISAFDHPNVIEGRVVIEGGPSPTWPEEMRQEWGEDSPWYVGRVLAQFPETSVDSLVQRAWIDRAFELHGSALFARRASGHRRRISVDVARGGPDSTCVGIIQGPRVESLELWNEPDLMATARRVNEKARELGFPYLGSIRPAEWQVQAGAARVTVDDVGVGGGVTDRLRELRCPVVPFNGAQRALDPERYANRRAESYMGLRESLMRGEVALPPDERLAEELMATTFSLNGAGKIILAPKEDIRERLNPPRSPDRGDTVSQAEPSSRPSFALGRYVI